jgi:hypothetical protein
MSDSRNIDAEPEILIGDEPTTALAQITKGEVDMQVSTAKKYPRDLAKFIRDAESMATIDQETAAACFYVLKRGGKNIEGPSTRLAEIVASCWGNLRCEARVVDEGDEFITSQGTAWDMEQNVLVRMEVRRRITDRHGVRYSEDMRVITGNAASSIAFRNAVFKVVPNAFTKSIFEKARAVAVGTERTLSDRRARAVEWFAKAGVTKEQLLAFLNKEGIESIDLSDLGILQGIRTAIMEGTTSVDEQFARMAPPVAENDDEPKEGVQKVGKQTKKKPPPKVEQSKPADDDEPPPPSDEDEVNW